MHPGLLWLVQLVQNKTSLIYLIPYCASGCFCVLESGRSGWLQDLPPLLWWPGPPACTDWEGAGLTPPEYYHPEREETGQTVREGRRQSLKCSRCVKLRGRCRLKVLKVFVSSVDLPPGILEIRLRYALKLTEKLHSGKLHQEDNYRENGIFGLLVLNKWYVFNHSFQPVTQRFSWLFTYETFGPARKHGFLKKIKIQCRFLKSIFTVQSLKLVIQYFVLLVEFIYYIIRFCRYL